MKAALRIAMLFAFCCLANAQIAATVNRLSDGTNQITIRNAGAMPLAAFAVSLELIGERLELGPQSLGPLDAYYDPATDFVTDPLLPNQERSLRPMKIFCKAPRNACEFKPPLAAGIYSDGSTTGDRALLTKLLLRRSNMLQAVETALETLTDAGRRNVSRDQLIAQFQKLADASRRWYVPLEQQVAGSVYQSIVEKLVNLPVEEPGSPFPPSAFVSREAAQLGRERATLIEAQPSLAQALTR
jgi:hypothetical protein